MVRVLVAIILATTLSSCGLKHWLGEAPPPAKIVSKSDANSQSGSSAECLDWSKIYQGTEAESAATFDCWAAKVPDIWKRVRGSRPDELNEREINVLIRDGVIALGNTEAEREMWSRRIIAVKNLLGFGPSLTRAGLDQWISWLRAHRADIRKSYERIFPIGKTAAFTYGDGQIAAATASSFLRQLNWTKSSQELADIVKDLFGIQDQEMSAGLEPGMRVFRNLVGFACPLASDGSHISTLQIADCLDQASTYFIPAARWIEYMINDKGSIFEAQVAQIQKSIDATTPLVDHWFSNPALNALDTQLWYDWAKAMGAKPPSNFIDSLKFLRRLGSRSNELAIYPSEMNRVFALIRDYEAMVMDALPYFGRAFHERSCLNTDATSWKDCALRDYVVRNQSKTIDMLLRVKNPRHGIEAVPINGSVMSSVAFFDATAGLLVDIFDNDKDGVVSIDVVSDGDDLVALITTSIETYQSIQHYINNISLRLDGKTAEAPDGIINLSHWNISGFAKLVAMANDVLVERTKDQRTLIDKVMSNISNSFPKSSLFLDRPGITAILTTLTSLPHYREIALQEILGDNDLAKQAMDDNKPISRDRFEARIGDVLRRNFPRSYQSCTDFGFEISCGIAFDEIMPKADDANKFINPSDLDVMTIVAIGMEGVFDTCGKHKDGTLQSSLIDGNDDLDCGFTRMKDVAERLLDSKIVQTNAATRATAEQLLDAINSIFLTRTIGKVALIRGTKDDPVVNLPLFWLWGKKATIGSSYALLSDVIASDRVDEAKRRAK